MYCKNHKSLVFDGFRRYMSAMGMWTCSWIAKIFHFDSNFHIVEMNTSVEASAGSDHLFV